MTVINRPVKFAGTREQADINFRTHHFVHLGDMEYRCNACDCKPSHVAAEYACGDEPPRETVRLA